MAKVSTGDNVVAQALGRAKRSMLAVFGFSFLVNLLLLTSPMFMLQVYDRVLLSRSGSTLLGLLGVAIFLLVILLVMEVVRNLMLNRISARFDRDLANITLTEVLVRGDTSKAIQDMNTLRGFLASPFILALNDIPWLPLFLGLVYFLHPMLGHIGLVGALVLFALAVSNDRLTRDASRQSGEAFGASNAFLEHSNRHRDAAVGMGMLTSLLAVWNTYHSAGLGFLNQSADRNAFVSAGAKVVRQIIQVAVLAMGGYLAIQDITTAGVMIAASIIVGRALAPIEQSIQGWRALNRAKEARDDLSEFMDSYSPLKPSISLPSPKGDVRLSNVVSFSAGAHAKAKNEAPVIKQVSLDVESGTALGITGPSGAGKSTLARLVLGIIQPASGCVRIDGAELKKEVQIQFSPSFGYLPQDVELFDGSVADNISRFRQCESADVISAAQQAGAHEMILKLADGYETMIGPNGMALSGGQKQRIGFARALFGQPCLVVLDEPTSNLDNEGRKSFLSAIKQLKEQGTTIILIAHQPSLFESMDKLALFAEGQIQKIGPLDEMMGELNPTRITTARPVAVNSSRRVNIKPVADNSSQGGKP